MDFDFGKLASGLIQNGGKVLGTVLGSAIGGPLGGAAGGAIVGEVVKMAAGALGVDATPGAVQDAVTNGNPADIAAKLQAAEDEAAAKWPAMAQIAISHDELAKTQIAAVQDQMKQELAAAHDLPPVLQTLVLFLAAIWRPLYALEGLVECAFFAAFLYRVLARAFFVDGEEGNLPLLISLTPFLTAIVLPYMAARFGLLGYYMRKRTEEKMADAELGARANVPIAGGVGIDVNGLVNNLLQVVAKKL